MRRTNKLKILNDPIYGFITIPSPLIFDLMEHPYFQRLRRITQLGLTYLVYPGAYHTRFHHALGAMHLMQKAVNLLRNKGHEISPEEEEAVRIAILLHDIGHGPFSHALENSIIPGIDHESLSLAFMEELNKQFDGQLQMGIDIFMDRYPKQFLHQLISSQLDVDRLDYLRRDCFYTGVTEGQINAERLITMLNVAKDQIVVDSKGIYSVEKFIVARRLMYWQVYLHKTVLGAEYLLIQILKRARMIYSDAMQMPSVLRPFLSGGLPEAQSDLVALYAELDDSDIMAAIKEWRKSDDPTLAMLCNRVLNRDLLGVRMQETPWSEADLHKLRKAATIKYGISEKDARYLIFQQEISNNAYNPEKDRINLLYKDGSLVDIAEAADQLNISALAKPVVKHFLFSPKSLLHT
ncbi:MAG: HD domain-containing protein [Bacteroidetes bacterium]|nr:HD domain-containing protein [Bacteroidota bacterium]